MSRPASKAFLAALANSRAPKVRRPGKPKPALNIQECLLRATATRLATPCRPHAERVEPHGELIERFVLPLSLCVVQNNTRRDSAWRMARLKKSCSLAMRAQLRSRLRAPLSGRPQVLCTRFSSVEPDKYADWAKVAVDRLVEFGLIVDDKPSCIDLHQTWEHAPPSKGFCVIEVYSGEAKGGG